MGFRLYGSSVLCPSRIGPLQNLNVLACREANQCADILARFGGSSISNFVVFLNPPPVVTDILLADTESSYCNRLVPA